MDGEGMCDDPDLVEHQREVWALWAVPWAGCPVKHSLRGMRMCRGNPQPHSPALDHSRSGKHTCFMANKCEVAMLSSEACPG